MSCKHHHHLWHVPLGVPRTKRRHQSPEWTILSHVNCFIQEEVIGFQVLLYSLHPHSMRVSKILFLLGKLLSVNKMLRVTDPFSIVLALLLSKVML